MKRLVWLGRVEKMEDDCMPKKHMPVTCKEPGKEDVLEPDVSKMLRRT